MSCCSEPVVRVNYRNPDDPWITIVYRDRGTVCSELSQDPGYSNCVNARDYDFGVEESTGGANFGYVCCPANAGIQTFEDYFLACRLPDNSIVDPVYKGVAPPPSGSGLWQLIVTINGEKNFTFSSTVEPEVTLECGDGQCPPGYCRIPCRRSPRGFCCCRDRTVRGR